MSTKPPTRIEVSVPGIRNDRGKLPPSDGAVGAGVDARDPLGAAAGTAG